MSMLLHVVAEIEEPGDWLLTAAFGFRRKLAEWPKLALSGHSTFTRSAETYWSGGAAGRQRQAFSGPKDPFAANGPEG